MAAVKALQQWCKMQCEGYRDVSISNMTTSFRDGLAFCALIHRHRPELIDFDSLRKENVYENNQLAFRVAEEELSIPALLDAEDMVAMRVPDRLSILTYVSQYYNYFHGRSPIGGLAGVKRPAEEPMDRSSGVKNQPVLAKAFSSVKPHTDIKGVVPVEGNEKTGTLNRNCSVCKKQVHLVQRHLVDGKLYHRNCFKCSECFSILLSGTYKPGNQPNTFICRSHHSTQKPPPTQDTTRYSQATPTTTNTINTNTTTTKTPPAHYSQATSTTNKSIINNTTTTTKTPSTHHSHATPTTTKTNNTINTNTTTKNIITTTTTKTPPAHYSQATPTTTKSIINTNTTTTKTPPAHYSQATPTTTISNTTTTKTLSAYYNQATPTTTKILNTTTTKTPSTHYSQATATTTKSIINNTTTVKTPSTYYSQVTPTITNTTTNNTINIQSQLSTKDSTHRILEKDSTQHIPGLFGVLYKTGSSTTPSPALTPASAAAPLYKPTPSPSVAVTVKSQTEQKVLSETPKGPSSSALKNLEARQRFFESSSNTVSNSASVSKGTTATTTYDKLGAGGAVAAGGVGKSKQLLQADDWIKDKRKEKEKDCDREKAKSVISKFVADETSRSSSLSSPHTVRSNTQSNMSPVPAANTRVLLKAPALDLELSTNPSASKTSGCLRLTEKSPARAANTHPSDSKGSDTVPSDWRALLKPVTKNTTSSPDPTRPSLTQGPNKPKDPTPTTSNPGSRPWDSHTRSLPPSSTASLSTNSSSSKSPTTPSRGTQTRLPEGVSSTSPSQKQSKADYIPREEILRELKEIEMKLNDLEKTGVELEKQLRQCEEENQEDVLMNDLMVDWFNLIRNKQLFIRRESELVYIGRSQDLEEEQPNVEAELRKLMEKPEHLKTLRDKKREEELMNKLMEIVNDRNAIVDGLDEDRLREEEEDEQLNKMMKNLDLKKEKKKRSSVSWPFWKNKREPADS